MTRVVTDFAEIRSQFETYVGDVVYATMTTVDGQGRPRARVLIPVWEGLDGRPSGWLATYPTPVKEAHLAHNPHTTFSYWSPRQNQVAVDAVGRWTDDPHERRHVWDLYPGGQPARGRLRPGPVLVRPDRPKAARAADRAVAHPGRARPRPAQHPLAAQGARARCRGRARRGERASCGERRCARGAVRRIARRTTTGPAPWWCGPRQRRRMGDSNPRGREPNTLSKRAP
ncbi:hypothetical protein GCM10009809_26240 [Isoptericola hypogeus]|uniref:Pyridoxamine 5'-phosphate oxidase n=1 Tax=Isoptericola hypogeus TaxID=300179 RepID=A0ABP4VMW3_9MICO